MTNIKVKIKKEQLENFYRINDEPCKIIFRGIKRSTLAMVLDSVVDLPCPDEITLEVPVEQIGELAWGLKTATANHHELIPKTKRYQIRLAEGSVRFIKNTDSPIMILDSDVVELEPLGEDE